MRSLEVTVVAVREGVAPRAQANHPGQKQIRSARCGKIWITRGRPAITLYYLFDRGVGGAITLFRARKPTPCQTNILFRATPIRKFQYIVMHV